MQGTSKKRIENTSYEVLWGLELSWAMMPTTDGHQCNEEVFLKTKQSVTWKTCVSFYKMEQIYHKKLEWDNQSEKTCVKARI